MREVLLATLLAGVLRGAVVRGLVVENQTGRPLARALVVIQAPHPLTRLQTAQVKSAVHVQHLAGAIIEQAVRNRPHHFRDVAALAHAALRQ